MGQTLTHGIYLPDEGERNCYDGLAGNWQLLDGAVGTIAEHTTQIAGKAPAVHTHGKADITDLFNSANTWTSLNTYNGMILLKSSSDVAEQFKQKLPKDVSVSTDALVRFNTLTDSEDHNIIVEALGHWANYVSKSTSLKYKNDSTKQGTIDFRLESSGSGLFYPQSPFECNLGNSSNQWKSVYAQSYYYNGTAWGLDKANTWTSDQYFRKTIIVQNSVAVSAGSYDIGINFFDSVGNRYGYIQPYITTSNQKRLMLGSDTGELSCNSDLIPANNNLNFGNSTLKWKTLNGINPGALSLPNSAASDNINITSWDKRATNGVIGSVTASADGWINIQIQRDVDFAVWVIGTYRQLFRASMQTSGKYLVMLMFPIDKNRTANLYTLALDALESDLSFGVYRFYPCFGNV